MIMIVDTAAALVIIILHRVHRAWKSGVGVIIHPLFEAEPGMSGTYLDFK